ncbi:MAG: rare lipoprotein A [Candidatus Tokpelaia sp. JSC189]|nr:MAG: rare lipoprotein A [Candidatus Tokpelaia sp. JSC189]
MVGKPYQIQGKWHYPVEEVNYSKIGLASWYGSQFHGKLTANGEIFNMHHLTAAHPTMPLPSYARVTNLKNGSSLIVRVNDRGPFAHNRIIDLSCRAAELLGYRNNGLTDVKVEYVGQAPLSGQNDNYLLAFYQPTIDSNLTAKMVMHENSVDYKMQFPFLKKPILPKYGPQIELNRHSLLDFLKKVATAPNLAFLQRS